jgi:hypothetical protein
MANQDYHEHSSEPSGQETDPLTLVQEQAETLGHTITPLFEG